MTARRRKSGTPRVAKPRRISRVHLRALLRGLSIAVIAVIVAGSLFVLADQPLREVTVDAPFQRVSALQVEGAVQSSLSGGFLSVDLAALRVAVEALPWVDRVRVRRSWPAGLHVLVTEQVAAARWGESGLLNTRGELFMPDARHVPAELPSLVGPEGSEWQVAQRYLDYRARLLPAGLNVVAVEFDERGAWTLRLQDGLEVRLGRDAPDARMARFVRAVTPLLAANAGGIEYVDMRYTNGFAVGWRTAPDPADQETVSNAS